MAHKKLYLLLLKFGILLTAIILFIVQPFNGLYINIIIQYSLLALIVFMFFPIAKNLRVKAKKAVILYIIGIVCGIILMCSIVHILQVSEIISLTYNNEVILYVIILLVPLWMFQAFMEEYIFRGIIFESLAKKIKIQYVIIITSLIFSLMHLANANISILAIINITLFGAICGILTYLLNDLYLVSGLHFAWNYLQGHFYGINISGTMSTDSVLKYQSVGNPLLSGDKFGVEGGLITTFVLILALFVVLTIIFTKKYVIINKKEKGDIIKC